LRTDQQWQRCVDVVIEAMGHPSYLRIDGRPVLKLHTGGRLIQTAGSRDSAHSWLEQLRRTAGQSDIGDPLIGTGIMSRSAIGPKHPLVGLFDFTATYMDVPPLDPADSDYPYQDLAEFTNTGRQLHRDDPLPHVPYLAAGWNPRPWNDPRPAFAAPTRIEWTRQLHQIQRDLLSCDKFGLPRRDGTTRKAFTIYAWNEFGEGGYVAPTRGEGRMKLEGIAEVFGRP
jgi:hypothetical protein